VPTVSRLDVIGERDGWRCWLCDERVDPEMSVNDPRGPSIDTRITDRRAKKNKGRPEAPDRLAHRGCNTGKGSVKPVVEWAPHLFVGDPAVIITSVERLQRKGGREVMGRCPTHEDAQATADWLIDRISRLEPDLEVSALVESGGGQYLVILRAV
jgi:hypothetical protein